jgi:hypothetical protein
LKCANRTHFGCADRKNSRGRSTFSKPG